MNILLTGANGLIGQSLAHQLASQHRLTCIVRPSTIMKPTQSSSLIEQDLTSALDYKHLPDKVDAVIHLAQSRRFREFPEAVDDVFAVNTHATVRLAEYAHKAGAKSFIFASTGGVYAPSREKLKEIDPVSPSNFYAKTKYASELLLTAFSAFFRVVVLRFFFVYGPQQKNMLIPNLFEKVMRAKPIFIEGNPGLHINPIFVEDAAKVFSPILLSPFEGILNVAGDEIISMTELVKVMAEVSEKSADISHNNSKYSGDLVADNKKMKDVLGVHPQVTLRQGLSNMKNFSSTGTL